MTRGKLLSRAWGEGVSKPKKKSSPRSSAGEFAGRQTGKKNVKESVQRKNMKKRRLPKECQLSFSKETLEGRGGLC